MHGLTPCSLFARCVGEKVLAALPDGAVFVNVGRGRVVDEAALVREAGNMRIQIALDVFETEPLAPDSPPALLPEVIVSPHIAGPAHKQFPLCGELALGNIDRFLRGESLECGVDLEILDILMSSGKNGGCGKRSNPTSNGRDASPWHPSKEVGGLGEPALPNIVLHVLPARQDV